MKNNKKTKYVIAYGQKIITDMSQKDIPKENFNHQDLHYINRFNLNNKFL